jgi:hypothetical protein
LHGHEQHLAVAQGLMDIMDIKHGNTLDLSEIKAKLDLR